jgi:hypothetical protein
MILLLSAVVSDPFSRLETQQLYQRLGQILGSSISGRFWKPRGVSSRPCRGCSRPLTR